MSDTIEIWEKHFGNAASVALSNPNFESFMDELSKSILEEDNRKEERK